ncbi:Chorismate pyruvate-lyase [Paraglaciecola mesophila]|uniref:Probable chorismate pyruvate-lyase n=1 Tax=Paraglaciecola mesophila TaxID=197222 RepID=A0A857JP10_9ALTE|nr:chorismate lyase [Paraglaciecola mesophila]QHJ12294.1 Chorismate pyruvate-lyase [Paraglaciecola mesophila]
MLNTQSHSYALSLDNASWFNQEQMLIPHPELESWLLNTGSLTQRLQSHCQDFKVQVVSQKQGVASADEYKQLSAPLASRCAQQWQIREVILHGDNQPWVFARSIIPQALCEADFLNLGDKPLGHLIFNDDRFKRQPFQLTNIQPNDAVIAKYGVAPLGNIWGRRSVFRFQQHAMMVAEVFLPQAPAYRGLNLGR